MTALEVAAALGITAQAVRKRCREGTIEGRRKGGHRLAHPRGIHLHTSPARAAAQNKEQR